MKRLALYLTILATPFLCKAQEKEEKTIITKNENGIIQSVEFSETDKNFAIPNTASDFFKEWLNIRSNDQFKNIPHESNNKEYIHEHFDQYYNGIKIEDAGYNFHYINGKMYFAHGHYILIKNLNTTPAKSPESAMELFARFKNIPLDSITGFNSKLIIKEISIEKTNKTVPTPNLVYKVHLRANHYNNNEVGYIDAQTGAILLTTPNRIGYGDTGTFYTRYNGTRQGNTQYFDDHTGSEGETFHLVDSSRGAIISVGTTYGFDLSYENLNDNNNSWTQAEHASNNDDMGLDIFWGLQQIYDFLYSYGYNSFNNNGFPINALIHFGLDYGSLQDNAFWFPDENIMAFGDGYEKYKPLASVDVIGHEFGHGITDFQISGWSYENKEAEMEEGLSDIWAAIMEYNINSNSVWEMGELIIDNGDDCLRNIENTHDEDAFYDMANTYLSDYYIDSSGVYNRSGVFSHWFYLLVNGGESENEIDNDYKVYGMGMDLAEELIIEAVYNNYLDNTDSYAELRTAFKNAAQSLCYNQYGVLAQQVENAWYAVGVGSEPTQPYISGSDTVCTSGASFSIQNLPAGATVSWSNSNKITRVSSQGSNPCTFEANSHGTGWIEAIIYSSCGYIVTLPQKAVWVGTQSATAIFAYDPSQYQYVSEPLYTGTPYEFKPRLYNPSENSSDYDWEIKDEQDLSYPFSSGTTALFTASSPGNYTVSLIYKNGCGWGSQKSEEFTFIQGGGFFMMINPNPASSDVTIELKSTNSNKQIDVNEEWDMEVYNETQLLHDMKTKLKGDKYTFGTNGWKEGVYIIRVKYKKEILLGKLVVKR
ncbi:MAG: M4 family metallopeptidase [Mariniphaga sp.]|nr:M4 family metallopeptidase [Mariniphaga sp.]